jgi:hypothetical protein
MSASDWESKRARQYLVELHGLLTRKGGGLARTEALIHKMMTDTLSVDERREWNSLANELLDHAKEFDNERLCD